MKSGYYLIELVDENGNRSSVPLIVKPKIPTDVIIIASTNTWQAYNGFGGKSFYTNDRDPILFKLFAFISNKLILQPTVLPFFFTKLPTSRPTIFNITDEDPKLPFQSHLLRSEWVLAAFLDKNNISYSVYSDKDFESDFGLNKAKLTIFNTHSEYWSMEMMGKLKEYSQAGGNVLFASGNNIYREIVDYGDYMMVSKPTIEREVTTRLIGSYYTDAGYMTFSPYKVIHDKHWVFKGTNINAGEVFGEYSANDQKGASGHETDKINEYTKGYKTLAIGTNQAGPAYFIIKEKANSRKGVVLNFGSVNIVGALFHDDVVNRIFLNIINRLAPSSDQSKK